MAVLLSHELIESKLARHHIFGEILLPILWASCRGTLTPNLVQMLRLITTNTSRGYEKVYSSHSETLGESKSLPSRSKNDLIS